MFKLNDDFKNHPEQTGGCWPTAQQELLLRAALHPKAAALEAWRQWRECVDIESEALDLGSFRLLPLVYHRLVQHGADDPLLPRLRGLHRRTWVDNQRRIHQCSALVQRLHEAAIPTLLLKGVALTLLYYPNHGVRPMGDFDVAVPLARANEALALLAAQGWRSTVGSPAITVTDEPFGAVHGHNFASADGIEFDLHWHILSDALDPQQDEMLWQNATPITLHGLAGKAIAPEPLVLHAIYHGMAWSAVPPVRWVADVAMVLERTGESFDWERLVAVARGCQMGGTLKLALDYLDRSAFVTIPAQARTLLDALPITMPEQRYIATRLASPFQVSTLYKEWLRYHHLYRAAAATPLHHLATFPRYFLRRTHTTAGEAIVAYTKRGIGRLRGTVPARRRRKP